MNKKAVFIIVLLTSLFFFPCGVFSQDQSSLVIFSFDVSGSGLNADDGAAMSKLCIDEINSWGVLALLDEADESNVQRAEYLVRGKLSHNKDGFTLSAETIDKRSKTGQIAASSLERASSLEELNEKIFDFCIKITQPIPFPNYLVGTWEASIPIEGSPLLCRLEFRSNRTVIVERYDTYEYQIGSTLKYEGCGNGTYTYISRVQRGSSSDATLTISLNLEDALPNFISITGSRIPIDFNEGRTAFDLPVSGLPCGENNGEPSVYPRKNMAYTHFVKK